MKVMYFVQSLASCGGVERILTDKANYLSLKDGYEVFIVSCSQSSGKDNAFPLSEKVRQICLSIPYHLPYKYRYPWRLWVKWRVSRRLARSFAAVVKEQDPDVLVGMSHFSADMVCSVDCRAKKVIESHEARPFTLSGLAEHRNFVSSAYMRIYRQLYFRRIERKADVVVVQTQGDAEEWRRARRVEVIPNFTSSPVRQKADMSAKRIIAVGRMSWEKGYDRLIEAWSLVEPSRPAWELVIFGQGDLEGSVRDAIGRHGLKNVKIFPFSRNIDEKYAQSSICVLTSHYEGFGLVLVEAFSHGVPCVAFDCPYGPAGIIEDGRNGYLVENGNVRSFAEALGRLMDDEDLRSRFSSAAQERALAFGAETIMGKWMDLFSSLSAT